MIYLDNGATTYPKPPSVIKAVEKALETGVNIGRGGYKEALKCAENVYKVRKIFSYEFSAEPENIIFTKNCTESLNMAIKGLSLSFKEKIHIVTTDLEHNSVLRPLEELRRQGKIEYTKAKVGATDEETVNNIFSSVKNSTRIIVCTHASNVFGNILPIEKIGEIAGKKGIYFIVDAAQTAGILTPTLKTADIICAPGHKGFFGPMGTGVLAIKNGIKLNTIIEGGSGSHSSVLSPPENSPERYEAGTVNYIGIMGLYAGLLYSQEKRESHYIKEMEMLRFIYLELFKLDAIFYTPYPENYAFVPTLSFNIKGKDSTTVAEALSQDGIAVRSGFHCAYSAHKHFGTEKSGTVRVSLSKDTKEEEIKELINSVKKVLNNI